MKFNKNKYDSIWANPIPKERGHHGNYRWGCSEWGEKFTLRIMITHPIKISWAGRKVIFGR